MHAGYDYLLSPDRLKHDKLFYIAISSCITGMVLIIVGCLYYILASVSQPPSQQFTVNNIDTVSNSNVSPNQFGKSSVKENIESNLAIHPPDMPPVEISLQTTGYGALNTSTAWADSDAYEPIDYQMDRLLDGFQPLNINQAQPVGSLLNTNRIIVPIIGINAPVSELNILVKDDTREYESPDNIVGHIPESANPGEAGSAWFFAHLESPIMGEGSLFFNLPQIPSMLSEGEDVYIIAENNSQQYLYLVTSTDGIHESEIKLYNSGWASIHLVTCIPTLVYDHRLVVSGELVGLKEKY